MAQGHPCPHCHNFLVPKVAKGGQAPHTEYVRCTHPSHAPYFYRFAPALPAPAPAPPAPPSGPPAPPSAPPAPPAPPSVCAYTADGSACKNGRIDPGCSRHMCRKHCNMTGACSLRPHEKQRLAKASKGKTGIAPRITLFPPIPSVPAPPSPSLATMFTESIAEANRPLQLLEQRATWDRQRLEEEERAFEESIGFNDPDLSLEDELAQYEQRERNALKDQERADMALAVRLSQEEHSTLSPPPAQPSAGPARLQSLSPHLLFASSPPPATPSAGPSRLRSLSLSPDLPASLAASVSASYIHVPSPSLGRAVAPDVLEKPVPRRRQQAASAPSRPRVPQVRITTQLNDTWMSLNGGSESPTSPSLAPPSPSLAPPSSSFLHVRGGSTRRPFANARQVERFTLVFLTGAAPYILSVDASQIRSPRFPVYQLSADTKTQETLRSELQDDEGFPITQLDMYLTRQRLWLGIDIDYVHTVSTDSFLILRRRGVHGPDDDKTIEAFLEQPSPAHLRYNLPAERAAVRASLKSKAAIIIDSDSEVEVVEERRGKGRGKRVVDNDNDKSQSLSRPSRRPRLSINTAIARDADISSSASSVPPSALFTASSTPSTASRPSTPSVDVDIDTLIELPVKRRSPAHGFRRATGDESQGAIRGGFPHAVRVDDLRQQRQAMEEGIGGVKAPQYRLGEDACGALERFQSRSPGGAEREVEGGD
ncbi:hypothetical protein C8R46DRAFT_1023557 [Mycena filopes]|nr:hypothetical protein C8R46DRAFT_1023557 [Mycena filopes]